MATVGGRTLWMGGYAFSTDLHTLIMGTDIPAQDDTRFGDTARESIGGMPTARLEYTGFFRAGTGSPDERHETELGLANTPVSVGAVAGAAGERAFFMEGMVTTHQPLQGAVGDQHQFNASVTGTNGRPLVAGTILNSTNRTATGNGTAFQVGAVGASQSLFGVLHVVAFGGTSPTLDVIVQSDDASGFPSATNRITFTQATGFTAEYATPVAGAITDDWWRVNFTIGGTASPNFTFICVIGIL
jgi:hypothetical protein